MMNKGASTEVPYEIIVENKPLEVVSQAQSVIDESSDLSFLNLADILKCNVDHKLIFDSNVLDADNQTDSLDTTSSITTATNAAFAAPAMDKRLEAQGCVKISESVINKENDSKSANKIVTDVENPFDNAFKMPSDYLPKRKRIKVESSGTTFCWYV